MYRDVSEIRQQGCNVLNASNQITNYYNNSRIQYTMVGNKYKEYSKTTSSYNYDTTGYYCYTYAQIKELQSDYDVYMPIYQGMAIGFCFFLFYMVYKIIVHKWWRKS